MPIHSELLEDGILYQRITNPFRASELRQARTEGNALLAAAGCKKSVLIFDVSDAATPMIDVSIGDFRRMVQSDKDKIEGHIIIGASRSLKLIATTLQRLTNMNIIHVDDQQTALLRAREMLAQHLITGQE